MGGVWKSGATRFTAGPDMGASQGCGATALGRREWAVSEVGSLWEEQFWKEEQGLPSDKLNMSCLWSSTWKYEWGVVG